MVTVKDEDAVHVADPSSSLLSMAFPIPSHLPRRSTPQDVSTKILSKLDAATSKTLNSALTTSWLVELDESIQATKVTCFYLSCFSPLSNPQHFSSRNAFMSTFKVISLHSSDN